jgi:hypothetical protein
MFWANLTPFSLEMLRWRMRHTDHFFLHADVGEGGYQPRYPTMHDTTARL